MLLDLKAELLVDGHIDNVAALEVGGETLLIGTLENVLDKLAGKALLLGRRMDAEVDKIPSETSQQLRKSREEARVVVNDRSIQGKISLAPALKQVPPS